MTGYAARLAKRMPRHNGYKTVGPRSALAQLHPTSATLALDEDDMLPAWLVYHELTQTAKTFLSKVLLALGWEEANTSQQNQVKSLEGGSSWPCDCRMKST